MLRPNTGSKAVDAALVAGWRMWQRDCSLDGRLTFRQAQRIVMQSFYTDGDSFTLLHPDTATGLKIQMIDSIFVPSFYWILGEGNPVVMGVEINRNTTKPEGYWARKEIDHNTRHLSAWQVLGFDQQAQVNRHSMTRYGADMVVHAYDQEYPACSTVARQRCPRRSNAWSILAASRRTYWRRRELRPWRLCSRFLRLPTTQIPASTTRRQSTSRPDP